MRYSNNKKFEFSRIPKIIRSYRSNVNVEFGEGDGKIPVKKIAKKAEECKPSEKVTFTMIKEYTEDK